MILRLVVLWSEKGRASVMGVIDPVPVRSIRRFQLFLGTSFTVDAFRYGAIDGCSSYFLSHFHYDHYGGLSKRWSHGNIYCTDLTARLLRSCLSVNPQYIFPLEINAEHVIEDIKVTLLEANHCPGAALILFRLKNGKCYLHTGDFRASKSMQLYPSLANHHIDLLYLDTTYCNPKYSFPSKDDVLAFVVRTTLKFLSKQPKSLIVVGAYSIGKEPVYLAISQALGVPIYANASRRKILQSFGWPELSKKLCSCTESSPLHVLPLSCLRYENLKEYLKTCKQQFQTVLAFRPTGWTYSESTASHLDLIKPVIKGDVTIYGVPYSEHSSFTELREFVKFLKPEKIIPTVNAGNAANRARMQSYFKEWLKV
ncbi:DNA cross-link repair protein SNM1 isoform X2 [Dendrobium catenatum]|uniref:DNA cross-link repair protein SNM1 isoform X2 n=1 Tax=Dendrobium catenatum TaxID=906689 RepID=UPI0010A06763|nr:DNA cross-link repair protein SNM1 isoform X2 [Dendrobium catenatum]